MVYEISTRCLTVSSDQVLTAAATTKHQEQQFNLPGMSSLFLSHCKFNLLLQQIVQLAWKTGWVETYIEKEFWDFLRGKMKSTQICRWPGSGSGFKSLPIQGTHASISYTGCRYKPEHWQRSGIATVPGAGLPRDCASIHQSVQTDSGSQPTSYLVGNTGFLARSKSAKARSWPLTPRLVPVLRTDGVIHRTSHPVSSWPGQRQFWPFRCKIIN